MFKITADDCSGCGNCVDACPSGAIAVVEGTAAINQDECAECGACQSECPNDAIVEN